jgi:ribonuclease HII
VAAAERRRLQTLIKYENEARAQGYAIIAGIDEAGRGPLAGPVAAAACIIPEGVFFRGINDSKVLTPAQREKLFEKITSHVGVVHAVSFVSHDEIDKLNIYRATIKAMLQAVASLTLVPMILLVDGLSLGHPSIPCKKIIRGDALSQSIAAASILAKVSRDCLMVELDAQWPQYGFKQHKGYATPQHLEAIAKYGPCPIHRISFEPFKPVPM